MSNIVIDLNRLTYREYRDFLAAGAAADEIGLLAKVVVAWDFAGDPADPASYDQLGLLDLLAVQGALRGAIAEATAGN
jgi:hypothetical protein